MRVVIQLARNNKMLVACVVGLRARGDNKLGKVGCTWNLSDVNILDMLKTQINSGCCYKLYIKDFLLITRVT